MTKTKKRQMKKIVKKNKKKISRKKKKKKIEEFRDAKIKAKVRKMQLKRFNFFEWKKNLRWS